MLVGIITLSSDPAVESAILLLGWNWMIEGKKSILGQGGCLLQR